MGRLTLNPEQDGLGYFYGAWIDDDGSRVRVDVLPPRSHPRPFFVSDDAAQHMHECDWIVYVDGEEFARAQSRDGLALALEQRSLAR
ncbi:MAG: hypothetical protein R3D27_14005 [Hyphomicrobiaceae bacterium]